MDGSARSPRLVYRIALVKCDVVATFRRTQHGTPRRWMNNLSLFDKTDATRCLENLHTGAHSRLRRTREERIARWLVRTCCSLRM